jgi:hypothetical protein
MTEAAAAGLAFLPICSINFTQTLQTKQLTEFQPLPTELLDLFQDIRNSLPRAYTQREYLQAIVACITRLASDQRAQQSLTDDIARMIRENKDLDVLQARQNTVHKMLVHEGGGQVGSLQVAQDLLLRERMLRMWKGRPRPRMHAFQQDPVESPELSMRPKDTDWMYEVPRDSRQWIDPLDAIILNMWANVDSAATDRGLDRLLLHFSEVTTNLDKYFEAEQRTIKAQVALMHLRMATQQMKTPAFASQWIDRAIELTSGRETDALEWLNDLARYVRNPSLQEMPGPPPPASFGRQHELANRFLDRERVISTARELGREWESSIEV